jgi:flavin-dependent dehydrogenase
VADWELSDVAIAGAGPAGCAAALTLRRHLPETSVLVVTTPPPARPAVGETVSPGVLPLLDYLGLGDDFQRCGHIAAGGTASAWGSAEVLERSYLFSGRGLGRHLDRARFDAWLLERVRAAGARVVSGRARIQPGGSLEIDGVASVTARAIIDAAGRPAQLARRAGARPHHDDDLVAEIRWYEHEAHERVATGALIESGPDGWFYSASLPQGRGVVMFMTDADLRKRVSWAQRLERAPATAARLEDWRATRETAVRSARSQLSPALAPAGCVAAGDAAAAFDPISSLGIGFSLRSGMEAARVAAATLAGDTTTAAAYASSIRRIYADYRARHRGIYALERRWPQAPFWARRVPA